MFQSRRLVRFFRSLLEIPDGARANAQTAGVAIVVGISNNYDQLRRPQHLVPGADYICFSDRPIDGLGIFRIAPIDFFDADPVRTARYLKTHLHLYCPGYDVVCWLDANAEVRGDLAPMIGKFQRSGEVFAGVPHPFRNGVYEEAAECKADKLDSPHVIDDHMARYRQEGFDVSDLVETGFFLCRISDPRGRRFLNAWWREIDRGSRRDQLSVNCALREADIRWLPVMDKGRSLRTHPNFILHPHEPGAVAPGESGSRVDPYMQPSYATLKERRIAAQRDRTVEVIVCVHNALEHVAPCLASVLATRGPRHGLIVVDDGSGADVVEHLRELTRHNERIIVYRNPERIGYTKAANVGLRLSSADFVILLNSDTVVTPHWIEKLCDAVYTTEGAGIVGPLSNAASAQSIPDNRSTGSQTAINPLPAGQSAADMARWCEAETAGTILPRVPLIHGFCFGIRRAVIETIGLFDESLFPGGFGEEDDYCLRASDAGFGLVVATHTFVFHAKTKSYDLLEREILVATAGPALCARHGTARVDRAVQTMAMNPMLVAFRHKAAALYVPPTGVEAV
jgi:GT2 family glycosyltransferase